MRHHVGFEVRGLGEPLPTLRALVRLQAGVRAIVQLQPLEAGKALSTLRTMVLLQVLVGPLVAAQAGQQLESFATDGALVWLPVRVGHLVELQTLGVAEGLAALETGMPLTLLVCFAVEIEALVGNEHLVTDLAVEALLPLVELQMIIQLLLDGKAIPAEPTFVGFGP